MCLKVQKYVFMEKLKETFTMLKLSALNIASTNNKMI